MESSAKRRKIAHNGAGSRHTELIDFESRDSARVSNASIFTLQTDELLKGAKLDYKKALPGVDEQLHRLKGIIDSMPSHEPIPISEATTKFEKKNRVLIPYPEPKPSKDAPYKLSFEPPSQCNVVGSYVSKTMVKTQPRFCIDMVVQMPKSLFQEKDFQNMRYFYRRAYYIANVAAHIRKELGDSMDSTFELLHDNPLLPILVLKPKKKKSEGINGNGDGDHEEPKAESKKKSSKVLEHSIRIIPCASEDVFPTSKLTPTYNSNRWGETDDKKASSAATPFYNSTLKAEGTFISYLRLLARAKTDCMAFPEACVLGRIWLQQRGFGGAISEGGFGHFEWAVTIALLLRSGGRKGQTTLSKNLSPVELFKAMIQFLSETDFNKKPVVLGEAGAESVKEPGPVLYDATNKLNILFKMTPWSANLLNMYAKSSAELLADEGANQFSPLFIVRSNLAVQNYDAFFEISSPDMTKYADSCDRRGAPWDFSSEVYKTLKKAYGNRADLVHVQQPHTSHWSLGGSLKPVSGRILVGVIFNFPLMSRQMEHGPPAEEQKDAARFRQFWGEKAELRRFKDGSILECVEWRGRQAADICEEITLYVLGRHVKLTRDDITLHGEGFSNIITFSHMDKDAFDGVRKAFQTFEYDIRNLGDLPLQIRQLAPVSPLARYASIQPPLLSAHTDSLQPVDVNMYFEQSSKWPENMVAIQEAKIEFLLDIDRRLLAAHENITTYLGRENREVGTENLAYLDVVYDSGAAFRLRIHCDLEEIMLDRQIKNKTLDHYVREEAEETLTRFQWNFTTLPLHTQTIATFCTRLSALSQSIRLVKHWFNSHKLAGHFSEELIEIIVLHVFLHPYPWKVPSSASTGFLRTLDFLSRWDWREEPLLVDSAEEMTADDRVQIRKALEAQRRRDPNMNRVALFVATSHDHSGLAYTRHSSPSKLVASRMTRLARAACKLVKEQDYEIDPIDLFDTSLQDYDVLLHLSPRAAKAIMRASASESGGVKRQSQFKNLDHSIGKMSLPIRANPVEVLLEELQRVYKDTLIFFRGGADGNVEDGDGVIAAIWNPKLRRQKFRAGLPYNFHSVGGDDDEDGDGDGGEEGAEDVVEVNRQAVLLEIARICGDMVKKIEEVE